MSIKSIKIKNLLSFDELIIHNIKDINCIVGKNNTGKSNLLKLLRFFYNKLDNKRELPPTLNSNYSSFGTITIIYDTSRINKIVTSKTNEGKSDFFKHIYNVLFKEELDSLTPLQLLDIDKNTTYELTLKINLDNSVQWMVENKKVLNIINYLYPFFEVETRHIDLYDWDKLWMIVSRLKSFNIDKITQDDIINFFDEKISKQSEGYKDYISKIQNITKTSKYNYREKVMNYVKVGLRGQTFLIDDKSLETQSDGTNSHRFIEIALELLISLSRRDYINPTIYIDEPEIGLHPKRNEELIYKLYDIYNYYKKTKKQKEQGKYKTPYPKIIFATHSANIVKEVIKLFDNNQQILHFSKDDTDNTKVQKMNSIYKDKRFINIFSDNEARLFFSNFILFVEGATEQEVFRNQKLISKFKNKKGEKFLQNMDVYATNDVVLKYINPSYANTAIPYLVLYDADKIIDINIDNKKLTFKKKTLNFTNYIKILQKSYIGSKKYLIYDFLLQLMAWEKSNQLNFEKNIYIENIMYTNLISYINEYFGKDENYFFNRTTIEEVLINEQSFKFFKRWMRNEVRKKIELSYNQNTPKCAIKKIRKKKIKEYKEFIKFINNNFSTKKEKITLFILIFGGKTETSIATFTESYSEIDSSFKKALMKIKEDFIKNKKSLNLGDLLGKTSGWTTSFLDFVIDEIEKKLKDDVEKKREKEFKKIFKKNFEELYDIITTIENKL